MQIFAKQFESITNAKKNFEKWILVGTTLCTRHCPKIITVSRPDLGDESVFECHCIGIKNEILGSFPGFTFGLWI